MFKKLFIDKKLFYITLAIFILLIVVVDKNNLIEGWKLHKNIGELQQQRSYYLEKIREDSTILEKLKSDAFLERFARENYLMKREGETIFIIEE